jgi:stage II sporulation protein D
MKGAHSVPMRIALSSLVALLGILFCIQRAPEPAVLASTPAPGARSTLRIGMGTLWHDHELKLIPAGLDRKITLSTCAQCASLTFASPVLVRAAGNTLVITAFGKTSPANRITFTDPATLFAHNQSVTLHNPVSITARDGILIVAVTLPIESYVERVVASESGPADSLESLKALAIVVRTFALHEPHGHADYDLCDSTHCQLLRWSGGWTGVSTGESDRRAVVRAAVLATAGETLWFRGARALAYFNKDCGGHTTSPSEIWPRARAAPYLPSQPDRFCTTGGSEWATTIKRADLVSALAGHGLARPGWQSLTVARRSQSGRAISLRLDTTEISAEDFHLAVGQALGWNQIPSTWFEVAQQGDTFLFHGRGWGHGVGLCQKGAAAMAAQNRNLSEILAQYFPGSEAEDETTGHTWETYARNGFVLESLDPADATYLPDLIRARAVATQISGLNPPTSITVRTFPSTPAFRNATLAPGWVAAFTEGDWIGTQPLRTLSSRRLLAETMRHEFLHALLEQESGPATPLWFREGMVEVLSRSPMETGGQTSTPPTLRVAALDTALAHASTETESEQAHRAAAWYVTQVLNRYDRAQALQWLRSGLPSSVIVTLGQR